MSDSVNRDMICILAKQIIGANRTEVLLVDEITFVTPVFDIIDIIIDVDITDCFVCTDKVIFNGRMQKNIVYKEPLDPETSEGLVRYREFARDFAGYVIIPGAVKGDECLIETAEVRMDCEVFIPKVRDVNGNITEATEKVIIDVDLKVLRNRQITVELEHNICPRVP